MTDLKRIIAVSKSEKIQYEYHGGNKYEGCDIWSSESEEVPADLPASDVEEIRLMLRERVNADLARQRAEIVSSLKGTSEGGKRVLSHPSASGAVKSAGSGIAKPTFFRHPANSVPAKPKEVEPDTPDGQPFA